ncbi:MAG TPA: hypothetical protein VMT63_01690 [Bacteroidales bacterium]|nr:hypothetical protein [Bacteroidales bacterium]
MKTVKSILISAVLFLLVTVSALAQSEAKVIAVVNKADWCSVCKANGDRAMAAFMSNNKDMAILFLGNNVTDDKTEEKSAEELKKYGLDKEMAKHTGTGVAYFFNAKSKKLIKEISIAEPDNKLAEALAFAKKGAN